MSGSAFSWPRAKAMGDEVTILIQRTCENNEIQLDHGNTNNKSMGIEQPTSIGDMGKMACPA